ncbi:FecR domain-containing protein [Chitinophaga sedimenti]|uniref:FecR family protein n=1 Tax=Chitinophaga sedimenti TaxID=2033606 RepID=UPI0020035E03|nr:FecR family protein [Chitinophaga sedimenti]MCK7556759.1 FecR domain-containing protein [Chitinophaga sedimenti]
MPIARIRYLVERYIYGTCTLQERHELFDCISQSQHDDALKASLEAVWAEYQPDAPMPGDMSDRILSNIFAETAPVMRPVHKRRWWPAAAAAGLLAIGGVTYWQLQPQKPVQVVESQEQRFRNEVQPGGNKALLTLADGTVIELDSAANGVLALQGGAKVRKLANGQIVYEAGAAASGTNTIRTPRGGSYQLTLPDGTQIWLNASSSITYPLNFNGQREVDITGEAYFEVAKDADHPFSVRSGDVKVQVLGTSFNINAYEDESVMKTTLLNGAIVVQSQGGSSPVLRPGQQARYGGGNITVADNVNTEDVVAWKNGYFQFNEADMPTVMRQLEKWYDVEVVYEGEIPKRSFGGGMQRSLPLTEVLKILEENNVAFRIDGRKIIVMQK